jgi:hypothetical protein
MQASFGSKIKTYYQRRCFYMKRQIKFVVYNRNTGKKDNKQYNTLQEAINEACRKNNKINSYNFLVTSIKQ